MWRIESAAVIGAVARIVRDLDLAEEIAHDALIVALERWPVSGVPDNPGAWLVVTARRRAIDAVRRTRRLSEKQAALGRELSLRHDGEEDSVERVALDEFGDDLLRLMFTACHPVLAAESRVALTLRLLGGLSTDEIARAFLVSESTIAQRIVRAKRTLSRAKVQFEVPQGAELAERLESVLGVIYLIYNEGYTATAGSAWMRPELCDEALRLGRMLAERTPAEPEVHGLVALMELQSSRARARAGSNGEPVTLLEQNRAAWDPLLIRRGLAALDRALKAGSVAGSYTLQAAIAACHARALTAEQTDWDEIARLYTFLGRVSPSPVIELNRAVAVSMASGPEAGLAILEAVATEPALQNYHHLPSVRGDILFKLGRLSEAREEFNRAAALTKNERERKLLLSRARACLQV